MPRRQHKTTLKRPRAQLPYLTLCLSLWMHQLRFKRCNMTKPQASCPQVSFWNSCLQPLKLAVQAQRPCRLRTLPKKVSRGRLLQFSPPGNEVSLLLQLCAQRLTQVLPGAPA